MTKFHDEFFQEKDAEHDALVAAVLEDIETIAALIYPVTSNESERQISGLETEKLIAGKNGFLVGYVDVIAHVSVKYAEDVYENYIFKGRQEKRQYFPYLIIDAKPRLIDIGAATRQIKTYQSLLYHQARGKYGDDLDRERLNTISQKVLVTNSHPSASAIVIAKNEKIELIYHDKETGRFELVIPKPEPGISSETIRRLTQGGFLVTQEATNKIDAHNDPEALITEILRTADGAVVVIGPSHVEAAIKALDATV